MQSEQFGRLAQMAIGDGRLRRVSGAIAWIKEVGYASASQFSREYALLFSQPPRRDAERMRGAASGRGPIR